VPDYEVRGLLTEALKGRSQGRGRHHFQEDNRYSGCETTAVWRAVTLMLSWCRTCPLLPLGDVSSSEHTQRQLNLHTASHSAISSTFTQPATQLSLQPSHSQPLGYQLNLHTSNYSAVQSSVFIVNGGLAGELDSTSISSIAHKPPKKVRHLIGFCDIGCNQPHRVCPMHTFVDSEN